MRFRGRLSLYIILLLYLIALILFIFERSQGRERDNLNRRFREFFALSTELADIRASKALDIGSRYPQGALPLMNSLAESLGIKGRVRSIRMTGNREFKNIVEERVEMEVDKLTMNELINLLYRIENHSIRIAIKDLRMKKDFENPERIDLEIKMAIYRLAK